MIELILNMSGPFHSINAATLIVGLIVAGIVGFYHA